MMDPVLLLVALFLPVFPLSMVFNAVFARVTQPVLRVLLLLGWPFFGVLLFRAFDPQLPGWWIPLALLTAGLYGFRLLAMREVGIWTGFLATSVWACLWLPLAGADDDVMLYLVWFGVPLALLALLVGGLEKRYGAAFSELYGGLAQTIPRFSGVFVITVLAVVATPVFPSFLGMLHMVVASSPAVAIALVGIWALWSWAGMRLIAGMIVGEQTSEVIDDLPVGLAWLFGLGMFVMIVAGFMLTGDF